MVNGEKAMEEAISDGFYPVINKDNDIFAIPSLQGKR